LDAKELIANGLVGLGYVAYLEGDLPTARGLLAQSLEMGRKWDLKHSKGWTLTHLGEVADAQGDYQAAQALLEESLAIWHEMDLQSHLAYSLHRTGRVAQHQADLGAARSRFVEGLAMQRDSGNRRGIADCLEGLAAVTGAQQQPERAARLLAAAEALRAATGIPLPPVERPDHDRSVASVRATLGDQAFAAAWTEGRAMPLEHAIRIALEEREIPTSDRKSP
jgi:ATP/maltotriose-dependent transcriptional regulator MalT